MNREVNDIEGRVGLTSWRVRWLEDWTPNRCATQSWGDVGQVRGKVQKRR